METRSCWAYWWAVRKARVKWRVERGKERRRVSRIALGSSVAGVTEEIGSVGVVADMSRFGDRV